MSDTKRQQAIPCDQGQYQGAKKLPARRASFWALCDGLKRESGPKRVAENRGEQGKFSSVYVISDKLIRWHKTPIATAVALPMQVAPERGRPARIGVSARLNVDRDNPSVPKAYHNLIRLRTRTVGGRVEPLRCRVQSTNGCGRTPALRRHSHWQRATLRGLTFCSNSSRSLTYAPEAGDDGGLVDLDQGDRDHTPNTPFRYG